MPLTHQCADCEWIIFGELQIRCEVFFKTILISLENAKWGIKLSSVTYT